MFFMDPNREFEPALECWKVLWNTQESPHVFFRMGSLASAPKFPIPKTQGPDATISKHAHPSHL